MAWTIKDSVSNLLPESEYNFRLEKVTPDMSKNEDPDKRNPVLKWQWTVVSDGDYKGQKQFSTFTLRSDVIGILGAALAATQAFDEAEELPEDKDELARILESRCVGKVYTVKYSHRPDKKSGRVWPNIEVIGPSMAAFG